MSKAMTATELRSKIYTVLDEVLETGVPVEVRRGKGTIVIMPLKSRKKRNLKNMPQRRIALCTPDQLVAISWEKYWTPD